ncbi:MAG TPA: ATP-binding protein [Planctomycetota bacterium]|nr:ATP-binding protein [Planctomycetota bacterium]
MVGSQTQRLANAKSAGVLIGSCQALHESSRQPTAMLTGAHQLVEYVNPAFCQLLGRPEEALLDRPLRELLPEEDRSVTMLERVFRTGKPASHTERRRSKASPFFWAYSAWPVNVDGRTVGVLLQVTESAQLHTKAVAMNEALILGALRLHELSEAAFVLNAELAASDEAKSQFMTTLSHELRSPLHVVLLWSQLLLRPGIGQDVQRKGLEIIVRSSKSLSRLVEDLLDVHRIASGNLRLNLAEVDLTELTRVVFDSMLLEAAEKGVSLECELDAPVLVSGDAARLQQVLRVLLDNAVRYTPGGGGIRVAVRRKAARAEVRVIDTGIGISAAALPHIFERYRQEDPHTLIGQGGLGLGLAIAKQLADLHGASLSAKSRGKGKGATFLFSLPLLKAKGKSGRRRPSEKPATKAEQPSLRGARVLVVDADFASREALRLALEHAAAETILAGSAEEALEVFAERPPQVVLARIGMPGQWGEDFARRVRALPAEQGGTVPLVALSAHASPGFRARVMDTGFQAYLIAPADPDELVATLASLVGREPPGSAARGRKRK